MNNPELSYVQRHDMIGIRVLKICGSTIYKHLKVIYKSSFQKFGKKEIMFPFTKKALKRYFKTTNQFHFSLSVEEFSKG